MDVLAQRSAELPSPKPCPPHAMTPKLTASFGLPWPNARNSGPSANAATAATLAVVDTNSRRPIDRLSAMRLLPSPRGASGTTVRPLKHGHTGIRRRPGLAEPRVSRIVACGHRPAAACQHVEVVGVIAEGRHEGGIAFADRQPVTVLDLPGLVHRAVRRVDSLERV